MLSCKGFFVMGMVWPAAANPMSPTDKSFKERNLQSKTTGQMSWDCGEQTVGSEGNVTV